MLSGWISSFGEKGRAMCVKEKIKENRGRKEIHTNYTCFKRTPECRECVRSYLDRMQRLEYIRRM